MTTLDKATALNSLRRHFRELALLRTAAEALEWDERTKMPKRGGPHRADQLMLLAGLTHQRRTAPEVGGWLEQLDSADGLNELDQATVRRLRGDFDKQRKLPQRLVEELAKATTLGQQTWAEARRASDFAAFLPMLEQIVALKREAAAAIGFSDSPYDALLDDYEPEQSTAELAATLEELRDELAPLVQSIVESGRRPRSERLRGHFPRDAQRQLGVEAARRIGFDFDSGRLDETDHPFCTTLGPHDCRITTHYDEQHLPSSFYSILHEAGHGIYEQGLQSEEFGLPLGEAASLGVHESQSRMWENLVGRSHAFWQFFLPAAQAAFPALADVTVDEMHFAVNDVRPSLIRIEADEATYNLHIIIRFELERDLIEGRLEAAELRNAWNAKYRECLAIDPPDDARGVLQDIHWSAGLFGYFPTYSLGNLFAAQLFEAAQRDLGPLDAQFRRGEFAPLRNWMREHVFQHGRRFSSAELVARATGAAPSHRALIDYLRGKLGPLYAID